MLPLIPFLWTLLVLFCGVVVPSESFIVSPPLALPTQKTIVQSAHPKTIATCPFPGRNPLKMTESDEVEDLQPVTQKPLLDVQEQVWRYAKKPLLRIGAKGATSSHGNSLRQLLEDHTVVKVKVNTRSFQNSMQLAYERIRDLTVESGAPADLELIQLREGPQEILFGMPGTLQKMEEGSFPPAPTEDS